MRQRCNNPNSKVYVHYGGRGIKVCKRWQRFENFHQDMGDVPLGLTLERVDNNKGYSAGNCVWATQQDQVRNKRDTKLTLEKAIQIIKLRKSTKVTYRELGRIFSICPSLAHRVCNGRLWPEALAAI